MFISLNYMYRVKCTYNRDFDLKKLASQEFYDSVIDQWALKQ